MRFINLVLLFFLVSLVNGGGFCGLEFMKRFYPNEAPSNCFYLRVCVSRADITPTFHPTDAYITNSTDAGEWGYVDSVLRTSALMIRSADVTLKFLRKLFSEKSELIEKNGPVWMPQLECTSCEFQIETVIQGRIPATYDIVTKACPKQ